MINLYVKVLISTVTTAAAAAAAEIALVALSIGCASGYVVDC